MRQTASTALKRQRELLLGLIISAASWKSISAFDIILTGATCDETLPVYITDDELVLDCDGENRCTFGNDAILYANLTYNGLEYVYNMQDDYSVYMSAHLSFPTLEYELFSDLPVPMCGSYVTADWNNTYACPGDGKYMTVNPYTLPLPEGSTTWLSTGWNGRGDLILYTDAYNDTAADENMVGYCQFSLSTRATQPSPDGDGLSAALSGYIPSAMITTFAILGLLGTLILVCLYRSLCGCCCEGSPSRKSMDSDDPGCCGADDPYDFEERNYGRRSRGQREYDPVLENRSSETSSNASYQRFS